MDPQIISINTQEIIRDSLDTVAPVRMIQITKKNQTKLTEKSREFLAQRDLCLQEFLENKTPENLRQYKNIKNTTNKEISKENYMNKIKRCRKPIFKEKMGNHKKCLRSKI